jgi:hypothetical protein
MLKPIGSNGARTIIVEKATIVSKLKGPGTASGRPA